MEVFLFPMVHVTLFPRTTKPLNVFEPRYVQMVKDAVAQKMPIAMASIEDPMKVVPIDQGAVVPFVRDIAGYGYAQIIEERPNGTLLIVVQGEGKVKLGKVLGGKDTAYSVCESEVIVENKVLEATTQAELQSLHKSLSRWGMTYIEEPDQRDLFMRSLTQPEEIIGCFAAYLVRDYDLQHMVLELNDLNEKVRFLSRLSAGNISSQSHSN